MKKLSRKLLLMIILISIYSLTSYTQNQNLKVSWESEKELSDYCKTRDIEAIQKVENRFLVSAGNYDIETMSQMFLPGANIGWPGYKDGKWNTNTMTVETWFESLKKRTNPTLYSEPVSKYTIHISKEHLAFVMADATLLVDGILKSYNMDYFILMKDDVEWKFLSGSFISTPIDKK